MAFARRAARHTGADCLPWPYNANQSGYGLIGCRRPDGRRSTTTAHRVVLELVAGPAPAPRMQAAHGCGNRLCVNPAHLWWAEPADNTADQIADGTRPGSYLTPEQVREVRASSDPRAVLATRYGVSVNAIRAAQLGQTHRRVA